MAKVAYEYILALQWNLHYYYNGVQSWSWYDSIFYHGYLGLLFCNALFFSLVWYIRILRAGKPVKSGNFEKGFA